MCDESRYKRESCIFNTETTTVCRCIDTVTSQEIVLKMIGKKAYSPANYKNEVHMHEISEHPDVIKLIGNFETKDHYVLVLEPAKTDLFDVVTSSGPLTEEKAKVLFCGVFKALENMHMKNVIHHDIKLENLVFTEDSKLKLIDFGLAELLGEKQTSTARKGSNKYLSPEILMGKPHDQKSDVWSLAVALFISVTGQYPFTGDDEYNFTMNVLFSPPGLALLKDRELSDKFIELLTKMLDKSPEKRPTISQCLESDWFK